MMYYIITKFGQVTVSHVRLVKIIMSSTRKPHDYRLHDRIRSANGEEHKVIVGILHACARAHSMMRSSWQF
jgi:hypothetical protein